MLVCMWQTYNPILGCLTEMSTFQTNSTKGHPTYCVPSQIKTCPGNVQVDPISVIATGNWLTSISNIETSIQTFILFDQGEASEDEIAAFIKEKELPLTGQFTEASAKFYERYNQNGLCLAFFTVDWSFDHRGGKSSDIPRFNSIISINIWSFDHGQSSNVGNYIIIHIDFLQIEYKI